MAMAVTVLGAGVSGLTTAVVLQEAGFQVELVAKEFSPHTTSDLAGALWYPSHALPLQKTKAWALETLRELLRLRELQGEDETGIRLVKGQRHFFRQMGMPWWRNDVPYFRVLLEKERIERARQSFEYTVPIVDMKTYLGVYLKNRFLKAGGKCTQKSFETWPEVLEFSHSILINCTGLGSYSLIQDKLLFPVRGQVLETEETWIKTFILSADHPEGSIYIIPRRQTVLIGGGSQSGSWDLNEDTELTAKMKRLAQSLCPELQGKSHGSTRVGLRPGRKEVRVGLDSTDNPQGVKVFHNYGHTGAGVTLSWGGAFEIKRMLN